MHATHDGAWAYGQLYIVAHSNTRACGNAPLDSQMLEREVIRSDRLPTVLFLHGVRQTSNTRRFGRLIEALRPGTDFCAVHMAAPQGARNNDDPIAQIGWPRKFNDLFKRRLCPGASYSAE